MICVASVGKYVRITIIILLIMNGILVNAQQTDRDTARQQPPVKPSLENIIHFEGFRPQPSTPLNNNLDYKIDTLTFNGLKTKHILTVQKLMRLRQPTAELYQQQMDRLYKRLIEALHAIPPQTGYCAELGYFDKWKMPVELMNPNNHPDDKFQRMVEKLQPVLDKYSRKEKEK